MATTNVVELPEEWRNVIDFEDSYEVSNHGNLRSKDRFIMVRALTLFKGRLLNPCLNRYGYPHSILTNKDKIRKTTLIHSLVAEAFIGPRLNDLQVNHIDGNKANNRIENLEYITCKENIRHAFRIGLKVNAIRSKRCTISDDTVRQIRALSTSGKRQYEIIRLLGVGRCTVHAVVRGTGYAWVN